MYSLLIDTHSNEMNLVIYKNHMLKKVLHGTYENQSKMLVPNITSLLEDENIKPDDLSEIIVVNGPGSFTGIRIGVTVAKTMAYSLNIPIKSISSLMLKAISINTIGDYSVAIADNKGYFIGKFNNNKIIDNYFYISKAEFEDYKNNNNVITQVDIDWERVFNEGSLKDEDCYNIKPLYIKKIEVEK